MIKLNCWQLKACGREPSGARVSELGACPAATDEGAAGRNGGIAGGRVCWAIAGTFCGGTVQGTFAQKELSCLGCDVYRQIAAEEGSALVLLKPGQEFKRRQSG